MYINRNTIKKKKRRKKILLYLFMPILTIFLVGIGYTGYLYIKADAALKNAHANLGRGDKSHLRMENVKPLTHNVSILLAGVDESENRKSKYGGAVRTDALLVATLNKDSKDVQLLSIPRDTYTYIPVEEKEDKINHAHAFGGIDASIEAVEGLLDIPIDYYVKINFEGFLKIIDELGGIKVDVPVSFTEQNSKDEGGAITLEKGLQTLNAEEALALVRTRKIDSDAERGKRQMLVIEAILKKALSVHSVTKLDNLIETLGENMQTNLTMSEILSLYKYALNKNGIQLNKLQLEGEDTYIDRTYYYVPTEESIDEISETLKEHLDL
ncbi:MAG: LCP family protein [Bacillaceae bacterium]